MGSLGRQTSDGGRQVTDWQYWEWEMLEEWDAADVAEADAMDWAFVERGGKREH